MRSFERIRRIGQLSTILMIFVAGAAYGAEETREQKAMKYVCQLIHSTEVTKYAPKRGGYSDTFAEGPSPLKSLGDLEWNCSTRSGQGEFGQLHRLPGKTFEGTPQEWLAQAGKYDVGRTGMVERQVEVAALGGITVSEYANLGAPVGSGSIGEQIAWRWIYPHHSVDLTIVFGDEAVGDLKPPAGDQSGPEWNAYVREFERRIRARMLELATALHRGVVEQGLDKEGLPPPAAKQDPNWGLAVGDGSQTAASEPGKRGVPSRGAAAALAAAAAAVAAAYWLRRRKSGDTSTDAPEGAVGYVLQLSSANFTLAPGDTAALSVTVWAVDSKGATSLAPGAAITISAPDGVNASPASGSSRMVAQLSASKDLAPGTHTLAVSAQAGGGSYNATVQITAGVAYTYALTLNKTAINLKENGVETIGARVSVTGPDPDRCEAESQRLSPLITFALSGSCSAWFASSESDQGGSRVERLELTIPDSASQMTAPQSATCTATVQAPTGVLTASCVLTVTTSEAFELAMDQQLRLGANDVAGSLLCCIVAKNKDLPGADAIIDAATPQISFAVAGNQAHWLSEDLGPGGQLAGTESGGGSRGKEVHPQADVPAGDLTSSPPFTASITASVTIPKYGTFTRVASVDIAPPQWNVELQPIKDKLKVGVNLAAEFRARVLPALEAKLAAYTGDSGNFLNQYLEFRAEGPAAQFALYSEKAADSAFRTFEVRLADVPKGTDVGNYLDVVAEATLCGQKSSQSFRINLSGKPELQVKEKAVSLVAEGASATVHAAVKNGDDYVWSLTLDGGELGEVEPEGEPETTDGRTFTLKLHALEVPEGTLGFRNGKMRLTARTIDPETNEEITTDPVDVAVKVGQVGLIVVPSPVRLPLDITKPPTEFRVRVMRFNSTTQAFEPVQNAMKNLEMDAWEDGNAPNGANIFTGAGVALTFHRFEGTGQDLAAVWQARQKLVIPAATTIDAERTLRAPGDYGEEQEQFSVRHTFFAPADAAAMASEKIRIEQANCRRILRFIPDGEKKTKFAEVIEKDARNLGAEGLYHLRQEIWEAARKCLADEASSYLTKAWVADKAAELCDWVAYVNGLIVQGMSSVLCPFPSDMVVNLLYGAIPEMVNAAHEGKSPAAWAKEWVAGFTAGLPGMGVDMALGAVVNLEDMIKQGVKEFKDLRKAMMVACLVFWEVRFVRYLSVSKPDGEQYSLKECVLNALRDLGEEVVRTGIGKNTKFAKQGMVAPGATGWVKEYDPTTGHGYDPKDGRVYQEATKAPDTRGMPSENLKAAQAIAAKNGVEIYVRPTNAASKKLLEEGALPKPEKIKAKTINELDLKLGRKESDLGKVGYFDPGAKPPQGKMTADEYKTLTERWEQRKKEFVDNKKDFKKLEQEHVTVDETTKVETREWVTVDKGGIVTSHTVTTPPGGPPKQSCYTGDHDIYDIRGKDGAPLPPKEYDKVLKELQDSKFQAQHPGHRQWDYGKPPEPTPDPKGTWVEQQAKYEKNKGIDTKIRDSHQATTSQGKPGESLIKVGSDGKLAGVFSNAPGQQTVGTPQRIGQAGTTSQERSEREMEEGQ